MTLSSADDEKLELGRWVEELKAQGLALGDIAAFARTNSGLQKRIVAALETLDIPYQMLADDAPPVADRVNVGTMHRAKGLEFKAVAVVGCEDTELPKIGRNADGLDAVDQQELLEQERCLFYVACTRARDRLLVTSVGTPTRFLNPG